MLDRFYEFCCEIEGFLSECIASYREAVNLHWWLKVAVLTDIGGRLNGDINVQGKANDYINCSYSIFI